MYTNTKPLDQYCTTYICAIIVLFPNQHIPLCERGSGTYNYNAGFLGYTGSACVRKLCNATYMPVIQTTFIPLLLLQIQHLHIM